MCDGMHAVLPFATSGSALQQRFCRHLHARLPVSRFELRRPDKLVQSDRMPFPSCPLELEKQAPALALLLARSSRLRCEPTAHRTLATGETALEAESPA